MTRAGNAEDGFVLVETLVAFMILVLALSAAVQAIGQAAAAIRRADAIGRASEVVDEISATRLAGVAGDGRWSGRHANGAAWQVTARALGDGAPPLLAVEIEVWPEGPTAAGAPFSYRSFALAGSP